MVRSSGAAPRGAAARLPGRRRPRRWRLRTRPGSCADPADVGSTAKTLLPLRAAPTCFSAAASANTSTSARGAFAAAASTARAHVGHGTRIDDQQLRALAAAEGLERGLNGVHGAHGGLAVQGLAELQQEVIARGDRGDVDRRLGARASPVVGFAVSALREAVEVHWPRGVSPTKSVSSVQRILRSRARGHAAPRLLPSAQNPAVAGYVASRPAQCVSSQ